MHPEYTKCLKKLSVFPRNVQNCLSCPLPLLPISYPNFREVIMDTAHTPSKTTAHGFFTVKYSCLFACACSPAQVECTVGRIQNGEDSLWKEPLLWIGCVWLEMEELVPEQEQYSCCRMLQPVRAAGDGGQEPNESGGVRIPPVPSKMRPLQCKAPQRERQILLANVQTSCRQRLGKENSGTKKENCLSKLQSRQRLGSD